LENDRLTGSFSGDRGSGEILGGSFNGSTVEFTVNVKSEVETGDWVFHGTLAADALSGSVSTTLGTFAFTGRRSR
ncbi:MAG: hypothetical protein ACXV5L_09050, partial [Thermoanaerobaculia bacterium]